LNVNTNRRNGFFIVQWHTERFYLVLVHFYIDKTKLFLEVFFFWGGGGFVICKGTKLPFETVKDKVQVLVKVTL